MQGDMMTRSIARELLHLHEKKKMPRPMQWALHIASLKRIFAKRQPLGGAECALRDIVTLAEKRGGAGGCTHTDVVKVLTQLSVAIHAENAQTFQVGKDQVAE